VQGILLSPKGSQNSMIVLKFANFTTNMAARGLLWRNLFCQCYLADWDITCFYLENIHPSGNFKGKTFFKPLCWNIYENCDVDIAIDHIAYQSKKLQGNTTLQVLFILFTKSTPQNFCKLSLNLILVITIFLDKKYGVTNLVSKIDAIDGKKWVKFVAMQQNNATWIYDLNTWKVQWRFTLKKLHSHSKQYSLGLKNQTLFYMYKSLDKTVMSHRKIADEWLI